MAKRGKKLDPYLFKGKLTKARQEYNRELIKLYNRAKSWERKYGFTIELPQLPKAATKKAIEAVKSTLWKNLTDVDRRQAEYARQHPEVDFERAEKYHWRGEALQVVAETHYITPRLASKYDELLDLYYSQESEYEDGYGFISTDDFSETEWVDSGGTGTKKNDIPIERTKPTITEQEIDAFLDNLISDCCDYLDKVNTHQNYWSYRWNMLLAQDYADKIKGIFNDLINQSNKEKVYAYLSQPDVAQKLRDTTNRLYALPSDNKNGDAHEMVMSEILEILNGGPLTQDQAQQYEEYSTLDFSNFDEYD